MSTEEFDTMGPGDDELFAGLHRSVAGATLTTSAAEVVALGRRTRNRQRALAAGIGTSAAAVLVAIGVLAPSAGTGAGSGTAYGALPHGVSRNDAGSGAGNPGGGKAAAPTTGTQSPALSETGFVLDEQTDGTIGLTIKTLRDPAALRAALDKAGVPNTVVVGQIPDGWDMGRGIECAPQPGVHQAGRVTKQAITLPQGPNRFNLVVHPSAIPAGDYLTLVQFQSHGEEKLTTFGLYVGRVTSCVPQHIAPSDHDFG